MPSHDAAHSDVNSFYKKKERIEEKKKLYELDEADAFFFVSLLPVLKPLATNMEMALLKYGCFIEKIFFFLRFSELHSSSSEKTFKEVSLFFLDKNTLEESINRTNFYTRILN